MIEGAARLVVPGNDETLGLEPRAAQTQVFGTGTPFGAVRANKRQLRDQRAAENRQEGQATHRLIVTRPPGQPAGQALLRTSCTQTLDCRWW